MQKYTSSVDDSLLSNMEYLDDAVDAEEEEVVLAFWSLSCQFQHAQVFILEHLLFVECFLLGLLVVEESLTVEVESLFVLDLFRCLFFLLVGSTAFEAVGAVGDPVDKTDPTELVFAMTTGHMVAALVFLDMDMAFRALLGLLAQVFFV